MPTYEQKLVNTLNNEDAWVVCVCLKQIAHRPPNSAILIPHLEALLEDSRLFCQPSGAYAPLRTEAAWALAAQRGKLGILTPVVAKNIFDPMKRADIENLRQSLGLEEITGKEQCLKLLQNLWNAGQIPVFDLELQPIGFPNGIYTGNKKLGSH
jgi:hypothetical protein